MDIVCSSSGIVNPSQPGQGIMDIANADFKNIFLDLSECCPPDKLEYYDKMLISKNEISRFYAGAVSVCSEKYLRIPVVRAPYLPRDTKRSDLSGQLCRLNEESILFCGEIGCRYIVIRPLHTDNENYYLRLISVARENQVEILLENQCRSLNGHMVRSTCSDGREAAELVDRLNQAAGEERFGFCMDVGVCSLCGQDMHEFAATLGKRIKAVVLRDCDGQNEGSMLPFTSVCIGQNMTDWLNLIRGLRETGFDGQMILNIQDTALAFSPLLRPQLMMLARNTAEYFKWQIEIENLLKRYSSIVLFGAGNMCRNYMKCYGAKYPPLFTCDNNQKMWGTTFCGLEVKPPEALKEAPAGCGIFICNIYYREIERQLRDMGIENIEFFNDEYMPSFYFDRLKGV